MVRRKYSPSDLQFQRWIKDGRGQGKGRHYKPWLTVRDVPSQGRAHRIFGFKSQRTHHLFSDLELAAFFILEWHPQTQEVRVTSRSFQAFLFPDTFHPVVADAPSVHA